MIPAINIPFQSSSDSPEVRMTQAIEEHRSAEVNFMASARPAHQAIIKYGLALTEKRKEFGENDKAFGKWVKENKQFSEKPFDSFQERSCSMKIAELSTIGSEPIVDFSDCPCITPTNMMKWHRDRTREASKPQEPDQASKTPKSRKTPTPASDEFKEWVSKFDAEHGRLPTYKEAAKAGHGSTVIQRNLEGLKAESKVHSIQDNFEDEVQRRVEEELSKPAKEKIERVLAREKKKLEAEFEAKRREDVKHRQKLDEEYEAKWRAKADEFYEENLKPYYQKMGEEYSKVIEARRGVFLRGEYELLLKTLHTDRVAKFGDPEFTEQCKTCIQILLEHKLVLLSERELPTSSGANGFSVPRASRASRPRASA
jgi:hypothetical protein